MSDDFYPFTQDNNKDVQSRANYATRIAVCDDLLSTPHVIVIEPQEIRAYLDEITNAVYRYMKEQGGKLPLMVIRELVENFIHASFREPVISILDNGNTLRFADQGPGIQNKELAFEFGVSSASSYQKKYIRGTGAGFPMVQEYLERVGGVITIEDNLLHGTIVTVTVEKQRIGELLCRVEKSAVIRGHSLEEKDVNVSSFLQTPSPHITPLYMTSLEPFVEVNDKGICALLYLLEHQQTGPSILTKLYGYSNATWSRELAALESYQLVKKQGQKRVLTDRGYLYIKKIKSSLK